MKTKRYILYGTALMVLTGLLTACGSTPGGSPQSDNGYVLSVKVGAEEKLETVLQQYGGEALSWHPEQGFAILKLNAQEKARLSREVSNQATTNSSLTAPEASAAGATAWSGGWNAWSGSWSSWSGGWASWGGGMSNIPALPSDNRFAWM